MDSVFISYAREDQWYAERIYMDLRIAEIDSWLDVKCLLPGMNWDNCIKDMIQNSKYFIFLISSNSNRENKYVRRELDLAFDIQFKLNKDKVFIIPVRLEPIMPSRLELINYNFIDLYNSYEKALGRILTVLENVSREPLDLRGKNVYIGKRDSIDFQPYQDYGGFIRDILRGYPVSSILINPKFALYLTFDTRYPDVVLPNYLMVKYPEEMTIVLQYSYSQLLLYQYYFTIRLLFNGIEEELIIPYEAIKEIVSTLGFRIHKVNKDTPV